MKKKLMPKKKDVPTWLYTTQHVDLMLHQYCVALEEISKVKAFNESELETLNYLAAQRYTFLSDSFKVAPSFRVKFTMSNGHAVIEKQPLKTIHDYIIIE